MPRRGASYIIVGLENLRDNGRDWLRDGRGNILRVFTGFHDQYGVPLASPQLPYNERFRGNHSYGRLSVPGVPLTAHDIRRLTEQAKARRVRAEESGSTIERVKLELPRVALVAPTEETPDA